MTAPLPVACSLRPRGAAPALFASVAAVTTQCRACGLRFVGFNVGDGPAAFLTLGIRALIVTLGITFELVAHRPFRAHLSLGLPLTTEAVMGVAKGALLAIDVPAVAREGADGPPAMTMRLPFWPTLIVGLACAAMVVLGVWQLRRAEWKEGLITRYAAAAGRPPIAFPVVPPTDGGLLFRRASATCLQATGWSARAGVDRAGRSGWRHLALCRTGAEGPGMLVDFGWSSSYQAPVDYRGGRVTGIIDSDRDHILLLVADVPAPGLGPSGLPSPANLPNNHRAYAVQWFLFAAAAAGVYIVALGRRRERI